MERRAKPTVFVSHSHEDKPFIERVAADLRRCQIDPWIDQEQIRHGQPWQKAIFEDGIPTCHAFLVYITRHTLDSQMVEREVDAALLAELERSQVRVLPYVARVELRDRLRLDLRTRQVVDWAEHNYQSRLPEVVAEIWRGFLERRVLEATQEEHIKRIDAEAEATAARAAAQPAVFSP